MLLFMLSLGGIPPTAGFMGKFWLFSAAIEARFYWLAVVGVLNSAMSLYYYVRIVVFMTLKKEDDWLGAGRRRWRSCWGWRWRQPCSRRLPAAAVRAGGSLGADARRGERRRRASMSPRTGPTRRPTGKTELVGLAHLRNFRPIPPAW